jgi:hypothetical protein
MMLATVTIRTCSGPGRASAQTVSGRVRPRPKSHGLYNGQSGTVSRFLRGLRFPLPFIHYANCSTIITICHPRLVPEANK